MTVVGCRVAKALVIFTVSLSACCLSSQTARSTGASGSKKTPGDKTAESVAPVFLLFPDRYYDPQIVPAALVVGDLNGDGKPDLVAIGDNGARHGQVSILLGNGDGTFQSAVALPSGGDGANSGAIVDVNGDGKPDLLVANCSVPPNYNCGGHGSLGVLLGNGDGTFQSVAAFDIGAVGAWLTMVVGDVNGDGKIDVLSGGFGMNVLLGNGDGSFQPPVPYPMDGRTVASIGMADVNGDGKPDAIVGGGCCTAANFAGVLLGNGDGTFQDMVTYKADGHYARDLEVKDVNGDGKPDLEMADSDADTVGVLLGNGDGTFQPIVTYPAVDLAGNGPRTARVGDVNSDGKPDLVVSEYGVGVLLGKGDGTFGPGYFFDSGMGVNYAAIADLNGDGRPDLALIEFYGVAVLLNNNGAPPTTTTLTASVNPVTVNQTVTYTASVARQGGGTLQGWVEFTSGFNNGSDIVGAAALTGNHAEYSPTYSTVGSRTIKAIYAGDLNHGAGSNSNTLVEVVRGTSKTALSSSSQLVMVGQPVTFTAKVTSRYGAVPDGDLVTFADGTKVLATVAVSGGKASYTTSTLAVGNHPMKATYAGSATLAPSTGTRKQVVAGYSTVTTLTSNRNPSQSGQAVTFTAQVTSNDPNVLTGSVSFTDGSTPLGKRTLNGGTATLIKSNLSVGTHSITATYHGDSSADASTSAVLEQVVNP